MARLLSAGKAPTVEAVVTPAELRRRLLAIGMTNLRVVDDYLSFHGPDNIVSHYVDPHIPCNVLWDWTFNQGSCRSRRGRHPDLLVGDLADVCRDDDVDFVPTDEHGNPVSWDSIKTKQTTEREINPPKPTPTSSSQPTRFALLELDDDTVTTSPTLLHTDGKIPTAQQVRRYRDVMESRMGADLTKAAKDAQLDEVAVYMLHRWLRGLDDDIAASAIGAETYKRKSPVNQDDIDRACQSYWQRRHDLDTREPIDTATLQHRQAVEEQRRRLADLAVKLAQERAVDATAQTAEVTRWSLLELDDAVPVTAPVVKPVPQPDPLTVWWSRRAAQLAKTASAQSRFRVYPPPAPKQIDDWTSMPNELRDVALNLYVTAKGLQETLN